jgi:hypothetical protein
MTRTLAGSSSPRMYDILILASERARRALLLDNFLAATNMFSSASELAWISDGCL